MLSSAASFSSVDSRDDVAMDTSAPASYGYFSSPVNGIDAAPLGRPCKQESPTGSLALDLDETLNVSDRSPASRTGDTAGKLARAKLTSGSVGHWNQRRPPAGPVRAKSFAAAQPVRSMSSLEGNAKPSASALPPPAPRPAIQKKPLPPKLHLAAPISPGDAMSLSSSPPRTVRSPTTLDDVDSDADTLSAGTSAPLRALARPASTLPVSPAAFARRQLRPAKMRRMVADNDDDEDDETLASASAGDEGHTAWCVGVGKELGECVEVELPHTVTERDALKRISCGTLVDVLQGRFDHLHDEVHIIDCRFPYEYQAGHIPSAKNIYNSASLSSLLYPPPPTPRRVLLIFHCEFSVQRAPRLALFLRNHDRSANLHRYPHLDYPSVYVLQGGYKAFYESHAAICEPSAYVEMKDERFKDELKRFTTLMKPEFKRCYSTGFLRTSMPNGQASENAGSMNDSAAATTGRPIAKPRTRKALPTPANRIVYPAATPSKPVVDGGDPVRLLDSLPRELALQILEHMHPSDVATMLTVSRGVRALFMLTPDDHPIARRNLERQHAVTKRHLERTLYPGSKHHSDKLLGYTRLAPFKDLPMAFSLALLAWQGVGPETLAAIIPDVANVHIQTDYLGVQTSDISMVWDQRFQHPRKVEKLMRAAITFGLIKPKADLEVDPYYPDAPPRLPLPLDYCVLARLGSVELTDKLIAAGVAGAPDTAIATRRHRAAAMVAAGITGSAAVAQHLLADGVDLDELAQCQPSFHLHLGMEERVLRSLQIDSEASLKSLGGGTATDAAAHLAAIKHRLNVAETLTGQRPHPESQSTPLHTAAHVGAAEALRSLLAHRGTNPDARDVHGWTPLHVAARFGRETVTRVLIEMGANLNARTALGQTPLHVAVWNEQSEVYQALVEAGATLNGRDEGGFLPEDLVDPPGEYDDASHRNAYDF
ncbi:cell division cycle 25 [Phlyctochytrium bullatum]|nr:cell division cycle 25 [Phlyctochytrium bullatum]